MNTKGPNGGKAAKAQTTGNGRSPVRSTGYAGVGHKKLGDTGPVSSNTTSTPRVPRQAAVNKGVTTAYNAGTQRMGKTSVSAPTKYNRNAGQPRSSQNTMRGSGSTQG